MHLDLIVFQQNDLLKGNHEFTWDQVGNYFNNFEIILPETHF